MTEKNKPALQINLFLFAYCALLFVYVFLRAYYLSFTIDEVTTVQIATGPNWMDITAAVNNHFLNTLFIKGSLALFEPSELVYRLPNVLGFLIYLIYSVKLGKLLNPKAPYFVVVLLTTTPFMLDFFGLARGYGLSLSFLLPSIYFLLKYVQQNKFTYALLALFGGMLAVLSNFSSLNFFMPLLFILLFFTLIQKNRDWKKVILLSIIIGVFLAAILPPIFQLKENGELFFGGRNSFYFDTIMSLSKVFSYHILNVGFVAVLFTLLFIILGCFSLFTIYKSIRKKSFEMKYVLSVLFVLSILSPIVMHFIFETHFPVDRAALLYFPILALLLVNSVDRLPKLFQKFMLPIISISCLLFLIISLNFNHTYTWKFDAGTKEVFKILKEKNVEAGSIKPMSLGINGLLLNSARYYHDANKIDSLSEYSINSNCGFDLGLEEFDINHYSTANKENVALCPEDAAAIVALNLDYYYLHDAVVNELIRYGYTVSIVRHLDYAGTSLVTIEN